MNHMQSISAWLKAGAPPHYVYLLAGYAITCLVLSKIPKVRANETIEAVMNVVNPKLVPIVRAIPVVGGLLAGFLEMWDSPTLIIAPKAPPKMPLPALLPWLLIPAFLCSGCAQYSACVKQHATAAFKQDTAANIETQVSSLLTTAASADWVTLGLDAVSDLCFDLSCTSVLYCAVDAWKSSHPPTTAKAAIAHQGAAAFMAKHAAQSQRAIEQCRRVALLAVPPICDLNPDSDARACREVYTRGNVQWPESTRTVSGTITFDASSPGTFTLAVPDSRFSSITLPTTLVQ